MCKWISLTAVVSILFLAEAAPCLAGSFFGPIYGAAYYREYPQRTHAGRCASRPCCCAAAPVPVCGAPAPAIPAPEPSTPATPPTSGR